MYWKKKDIVAIIHTLQFFNYRRRRIATIEFNIVRIVEFLHFGKLYIYYYLLQIGCRQQIITIFKSFTPFTIIYNTLSSQYHFEIPRLHNLIIISIHRISSSTTNFYSHSYHYHYYNHYNYH